MIVAKTYGTIHMCVLNKNLWDKLRRFWTPVFWKGERVTFGK
jgi:hypothetical protein